MNTIPRSIAEFAVVRFVFYLLKTTFAQNFFHSRLSNQTACWYIFYLARVTLDIAYGPFARNP